MCVRFALHSCSSLCIAFLSPLISRSRQHTGIILYWWSVSCMCPCIHFSCLFSYSLPHSVECSLPHSDTHTRTIRTRAHTDVSCSSIVAMSLFLTLFIDVLFLTMAILSAISKKNIGYTLCLVGSADFTNLNPFCF